MYHFLDSNIEITAIEPEYTAMYCAAKAEVTFFYNGMIEGSQPAESLEDASASFSSWVEEK